MIRRSRRSLTEVVGCGSNVVDRFLKLKKIPRAGEKGYFADPTKTIEKVVVGGVTLNHLCWASALKVPTGLLCRFGTDESGRLIRQELVKHNVSEEFIDIQEQNSTAESYIFLQPDGERAILMASGSSSQIDAKAVDHYFSPAIKKAKILTTEISQVPLSGVQRCLDLAKAANVLRVLDLDVSPTVAMTEADLGSFDQLWTAVRSCEVLKPTRHAAVELISMVEGRTIEDVDKQSDATLCALLRDRTGAKLVALTAAEKGSTFSTDEVLITVAPNRIEKVVDSTGAGDAFLGGLVACLYHWGLPWKQNKELCEKQLRTIGHIANALGGLCCTQIGGLPTSEFTVSQIADVNPALKPEVDHIISLPPIAVQQREAASTMKRFLYDAGASASKAIFTNTAPFEASENALKEVIAKMTPAATVYTTGVGKSASAAHRLATSLSSVGVAASFVHAAEWGHGEFGKLFGKERNPIVLLGFSNRGETEEVVRVFDYLRHAKNAKAGDLKPLTLVSVIGRANCSLAKLSDININYTAPDDLLDGLAPSDSLLIQETVNNAIMRGVIDSRSFSTAEFKRNHPVNIPRAK